MDKYIQKTVITPKNTDISGLIITYNEEKNIKELLDNIDFVNEIVIIDSFSNDKTKQIALEYPNVKFIEHPFKDFTSQRNFALDHASCSWILFMDGDERITPSLKLEILETVKNKESKDAYYFYRKFMYKNSKIHFSGTQTDKNFRLFKKDKAKYKAEKLVHETLEVNGSIGILKNKLMHYSFDNYAIYKRKMANYGKLKAQELATKNKKATLFHRFIKPTYKFIYNYIVRLGFLDGFKGFTLCYLHAFSVYITYKELHKIY
jgi:glycosyltransferase involved in cell wall biosynthesis